jgi:hypothetical protein
MASKDPTTRCLEALGVIVLALFLKVKPVTGQETEVSDPVEMESPAEEALRVTDWKIMDRLVETYGSTRWSAVAVFLGANPWYEGNPNIVFIPLSLGNVYLNRYEWQHDIADLERSVEWFEWVAFKHWLWGRRWLAAPVVSYLDISLLRLRASHRPIIQVGWRRSGGPRWRSRPRADARLTPGVPSYRPYDSSATGVQG